MSMFGIMFAAFGAGQSNAFMPDVGINEIKKKKFRLKKKILTFLNVN